MTEDTICSPRTGGGGGGVGGGGGGCYLDLHCAFQQTIFFESNFHGNEISHFNCVM